MGRHGRPHSVSALRADDSLGRRLNSGRKQTLRIMMKTAITRRFQLSCPLFQAPMAGGGDTAELVAAVCNAGGLGFIGAAYLTPEQIMERRNAVRRVTDRPFGINLFAPLPVPAVDESALDRAVARIAPYYAELGLPSPQRPSRPPSRFEDQLTAALEIGASAFSFAFGLLPREAIDAIKRNGIFCLGTATTVREAQLLVDSGVDAVIAQGSEAGGHRSTFASDFETSLIGSMALIPQVTDAVSVPVIASGGIMDGRGIAAALTLGASAVQMGTAFLTCEEAGIAACYKEAILSASEDQTRITRAFSGRPARGIANRMLRDYEDAADTTLPFPWQNALTRPLRNESARQSRTDYLSLWAGQGVRSARRTTAAELVRALNAELQHAIAGMRS
jgi:nitronate monooxygenase